MAVGDLASLQYSSSSASGFSSLASLIKAEPLTIDIPAVDTTNLNSAAASSIPGMPDYGEIKGTYAFDSGLVSTVMGWVTNKSVLFFRVQVNDGSALGTGSTDVVQGWIKSYRKIGDLENNKRIVSEITIKVTGSSTFTAGS